jgi:hypothetical protein
MKNNSQQLSGGLCGTKKSSEDRTVPAVSGAGMRKKTGRLNVPVCTIKMKLPRMDIAIATSILKRSDYFFKHGD